MKDSGTKNKKKKNHGFEFNLENIKPYSYPKLNSNEQKSILLIMGK